MATKDYFRDPSAMNVPWALSPFFDPTRLEGPIERSLAERFRRDGYVVIEEPVVDSSTIDRVVEDLHGRYDDSQTGHESPSRKMDAWRTSDAVAGVAGAPRVLELLEALYGRRPFPFQTLNFERGTEQRAHSDTIHFHSIPQRFMAGVWVALEDIDPGSGPLVVYPGSHHLPIYDPLDLAIETGWEHHEAYEDAVEALVDVHGLEPHALLPRRGQAVVWAANLLHGGGVVDDPSRTRLSQATHYYFENCMYYQPAASDPYVGRLSLKDVVDVTTGRPVPHRYRGRPLDEWGMPFARRGWRRLFGGDGGA